MAEVARRRNDPRREATRIALIEATERLIAEAGVEGVSTRRIGAAIGSANTSVVSYHFGSKDALVEAVCRHRLPAIDARRRALLDAADAGATPPGVADLVRVFALPLFEQVDSEGRHSFARFIAGLERSGMIGARGALVAEFPETERVIARMAALPGMGDARAVARRLRLAMGMLVTALQIIDREMDPGSPAARQSYDEAMTMATAALLAGPAAGDPA